MDNNNYRKWRYLMARKLVDLYFQEENDDWTPTEIHKRIGVFFTAVNEETFKKYCKSTPVFEEELPLFVEALLAYAEEFRQVARLLETGLKRPSDYPAKEYPQYEKMVKIFLRRQKKRLDKEHEAREKKRRNK